MRWFSPARLAAVGLFLLGAAAFVLWLAPANGYDIRLVDPAHPVDSVITVPGEKPGGPPGPIYFVDVRERPARLLERLLPWTRADGSDLVPSPPIPATLERRLGQLDMTDSQKISAVVALKHLGYKVRARSGGVTVLLVQKGAPAANALRPGDVIVSANGRKVASVLALRTVLAAKRPGATVKVGFRRAGKVREATIKTVADPQDPKRAIIGVSASDELTVKLPVPIKFDAGGVGGPFRWAPPSRSNPLQELGSNIAHGKKVAATGALSRRHGRRDRRREAKDPGCARSGCGRLPRAGGGQRARGETLCEGPADRACEELSTSVRAPRKHCA